MKKLLTLSLLLAANLLSAQNYTFNFNTTGQRVRSGFPWRPICLREPFNGRI